MLFKTGKIIRRPVASVFGLLLLGSLLGPPAGSVFGAGLKLAPPQKASARVQKKEKQPQLPERYQKWLEEEVAYIITPVEKDIFLKLRTDRERDLFME
ncbi:MAG: hypothetical protein NUW07_03115, partial [Candidatus Saccharicenans sp.]|nr:hypothetical protein [Candidatus Saccharicenans sp.]